MRTRTLLTLAAICISAHAPGVRAQVPVLNDTHLINQHIDNHIATRSDAWWAALEAHLLLMMDVSHDSVDQQTLQNVIFYAGNFPKKVNLRATASTLLEIRKHHADPAMRVMATAALHAIGEDAALRKAIRSEQPDESPLVRRVTEAAMKDLERRSNR